MSKYQDKAKEVLKAKATEPKPQMINIKKIQYIGVEDTYILKDTNGYRYEIMPQEIFYVPDDSLANYLLYKRTLFKELPL